MKLSMWLVLVGVVGFTLGGCKKKEPAPTPPPPPATPQVDGAAPAEPAPVTGEDVKRDAGQAAKTTGEYLAQKKDDLVASAKEELEDLDVKTAELRAQFTEKSKEWTAEAKAKWEDAMVELEHQKEAAKVKWAELKDKSGPVLEKAEAELDAATDKAVSLWKRLKAKVSGEEPPAEPAPPPPAPEPSKP